MAVLPNLKQVVAGKLASKFKSFVGGIGKGKLGLPPNMSDFASLGAGGKGGMANLSFPLDVTSGPGNGNHGHYVIFFVNEQVNAKIGFSAIKEPKLDAQYSDFGMDSSVGKTHVNTNIKVPTAGGGSGPLDVRTYGTKQQQANSAIKSAFAKPNRAVVKRAPTRKGVASISMYMPAQVQSTYAANYTDTQIGLFTGDALNVFDNLTASGMDRKSAQDSIVRIGTEQLPTALTLMLQTTLGALPGLGGLREARGIMTGEIISDRMELAFKSINKRKFQYTFKMIPKSATEAAEIKDIITQFKKNMLPEFAGGDTTGRRFVVPNTFNIQYMYNGAENQFLHKIGECVLENMTVNYGGDRYRTYTPQGDGAPVAETTITLAFAEMDLVTRKQIMEGF
tara:strand:+ start:359 stop:1540 length:1182 start_codon:yes stop_codon:yes gene_type:complete